MIVEQTKTWQSKEWQVTRAGLERMTEQRDRRHQIAAADLAMGSSDVYASWPVHMARKASTDLDDFVKAFLAACVIHGVRIENVAQMVTAARETRRHLELKGLPTRHNARQRSAPEVTSVHQRMA